MKKKAVKRDVEKAVTRAAFVRKLRRLADDIEAGRPFRIQVAGETLTAPVSAEISIEHEREGGVDELEFQLRWKKRR